MIILTDSIRLFLNLTVREIEDVGVRIRDVMRGPYFNLEFFPTAGQEWEDDLLETLRDANEKRLSPNKKQNYF